MISVVRLLAPAKVNLRLVVLAREVSGYHGLETIFQAISLADEVRVERGPIGVHLEVEGGIETGPADRNLAVRAARSFYGAIREAPWVRLHLRKRIPAAAGLGGGSSDAAAALRALNALEGEPLSSGRLLELGAELGGDVPFFLSAAPLAFGWARGQRLLGLPALSRRSVLVGHPGIPMSTPAAFNGLAELRGGEHEARASVIASRDLSSWPGIEALATNDFDAVAAERIANHRAAARALRDHGARIALLAGSGAAIFGVFAEDEPPHDAARALRDLGYATWVASTLDRWPQPRAG